MAIFHCYVSSPEGNQPPILEGFYIIHFGQKMGIVYGIGLRKHGQSLVDEMKWTQLMDGPPGTERKKHKETRTTTSRYRTMMT